MFDDCIEDFLGGIVRAEFFSLECADTCAIPVFPRTWGMMDLSGIEFDVPVALLESPVAIVPDDPEFDGDLDYGIDADDDDDDDDDDDFDDDLDDDDDELEDDDDELDDDF
jgi:hypothetical protein